MDLNDIQDCIVANKRRPWKKPVGTIYGGGTAWSPTLGLTGWSSSASGSGTFHIPCDVGDRIIGCELVVSGDNSRNVTYTLQVASVSGGVIFATQKGVIAETPAPTNIRTIVVGSFIPTVLANGQWFQITATVNGPGISLYNVIPEFDRL